MLIVTVERTKEAVEVARKKNPEFPAICTFNPQSVNMRSRDGTCVFTFQMHKGVVHYETTIDASDIKSLALVSQPDE